MRQFEAFLALSVYEVRRAKGSETSVRMSSHWSSRAVSRIALAVVTARFFEAGDCKRLAFGLEA